ncbi:MAG: AI-2E family transporter [Bacteroidia bacterium]|nr:AI-2E family transporter [Bacteroidia bacterium]
MEIPGKIPFFVRASLICMGMLAFVSILYYLRDIIVPVIYAIIIAIVLSPIVNFFVSKGMNRIIAISITLLLVIIVSISIVALLSTQASMFSESFPALVVKFKQILHQTQNWVAVHFHISTFKINKWIEETNDELINNSRSLIGATLANIGGILIILVLIPVYIFMILYYKPLLIEFIHRVFSSNKHRVVNEVLGSTKKIIQSYLVGLLLEAIIIATLNSTSLLILGIDYAILLGVIGAMLNVIPYIGGIIAVTLPMIIALATKSPTYALLVLFAYLIIQFIDNHIIIPNIVASKVKINALISVIVVLAGGALWGIPGMFLSIPLTAILKLIFDHIDGLKPWGYLLGNNGPEDLK